MAEQFLTSLIEAAKLGSSDALSELSSIALGGNEEARTAIAEIDSAPWTPVENVVVQGIIWPGQDQPDWQGPKKGDVPLHNNV